jgi:tRNA-dihydrouridine synthase
LAPLHGITLFPFRNTFLKHFKGIDKVMAPFVPAVQTGRFSLRLYRDILPENNLNISLIPQLLGHDKTALRESCKVLQSMGYSKINWNLGCPSKSVVGHGRGCGLMPNTSAIMDIIEEVLKLDNLEFSLKIRLGLNHPEESERLIENLRNYPISEIIIHPRLGVAQYEGVVDLARFEKLYQSATQPIIYNGDIKTLQDIEMLHKRFPKLEQFMLGRGLLKNPFLAEEIRNNDSTPKKKTRFWNFYDEYQEVLLIHFQNHQGILSHLKELWRYFYVFFNLNDTELNDFLRSTTLSELEDQIYKYGLKKNLAFRKKDVSLRRN